MTNISQKVLYSLDVLVPFTRNYAQKIHASELSRQLHLPQRTVSRKIELLENAHLLQYQKKGRNKYYFFNLQKTISISLITIIECYKEIQFTLQHPQVALLLKELSTHCPIILFGSYAKGKETSHSDLDLVLFSEEKKELQQIITKYPFQVQPQWVSFRLFEKRLREAQPLAKEIMKDHLLFGEKERLISLFKRYCHQ